MLSISRFATDERTAPALKALTHPSHPHTPPADQPPQKFFLKYWLLYNFLNVATLVLPPLAWVPFFPLIKLLLLLWAYNPKTQGADFLYANLRAHILPPLGIEPLPQPPAAAATASRKKSLGASSASTATAAAGGGGAAAAVVGDETQPGAGTAAATYTLKVELAARGLEKPPEPERLDTLCQLRVLPGPNAGRKAALDEGQWWVEA